MLNLNFVCVACGRCCNGSFAATVDEALELGAKVPLALSIIHTNGPLKNPSPAQGKAERRYILRYTTPKGTCWVQPGIASLNSHEDPCAFLSPEKLCRLEGADKPLRCRTMPIHRGTDPAKGLVGDLTGVCPPEVHRGPALVRSGRVVDPDYAAAATAELAAMERDLPVVAKAVLYAARVFDATRAQIEDSKVSDLWAVTPAFLALSACAQGRWTLEQGAAFCDAQAQLLDRAKLRFLGSHSAFSRRVSEFAAASRTVGRDLSGGGGFAMEDWMAFEGVVQQQQAMRTN